MARATLLFLAGLAVHWAWAQDMVTGEYWIDTDPGFGMAAPMPPQPQGIDVDYQFPVSTTALSPGMHTLAFRTKDASGRWSHTNHRPLFIAAAPPAESSIVRTEYFLNNDPGWGNGTDAGVDGAADIADAGSTASVSDAVPGMNTLCYRSQDASGRWSHTNHRPLFVADSSSGVIVRVEYFWQDDPGFGQGSSSTVPSPAGDVPAYLFPAQVPSGVGALDTLLVRTLDSCGRWSHTNHVVLDVSTATDELTALGVRVFPNPFTERIMVQPTGTWPLHAALYDPAGRKVHERMLEGSTTIDLRDEACGTYTLLIGQAPGLIHRVVLVKQ